MKLSIVTLIFLFTATCLSAQSDPPKRTDFAKTYFEVGGTYFPSFTGKRLADGEVQSFRHSASSGQYLTWGGFHFWGRAEFYVTFPLHHTTFNKVPEGRFHLLHSVATGGRFYPWAFRQKALRPYVGVNWGALEFQQQLSASPDQPRLSKDFLPGLDGGLVYGRGSWVIRAGANYFTRHHWQYPLSKQVKASIKTPPISVQLGVLYTMDFTKKGEATSIDRWNAFPSVSSTSLGASRQGAWFVGVGPSLSFTLSQSAYTRERLPYLQDQMASSNYFDWVTGYHFYKAQTFVTLAFRNPTFTTAGFGDEQRVRKTSLAVEACRFLTDYSGFAPFIGVNLAYDRLQYTETVAQMSRSFVLEGRVEPGITFGWDILPGKTEEALILRTNLRWYPFAGFEVDEKAFRFSQLEYNLIQAVLYPGRIKR